MTEPIKCFFRREADIDGRPQGEWEKGAVYDFIPANDGYGAVVSAEEDGATLVIPVFRLAFTTEHPDEIKKRVDAAKKVKADALAKARAEAEAKAQIAAVARVEAEAKARAIAAAKAEELAKTEAATAK
jgi:hypothetical protein